MGARALLLGSFVVFLTLVGSWESSGLASSTASTTAVATGTLVTSISITKTADLNFGKIAAEAGTAYDVTGSPAGVFTAGTGGSAGDLMTSSPTRSAASFSITGQASATYAISLPTSITLVDGASNSMTVDTFTSSPTPTGTLSTLGAQTLTVGATLHLNANQTQGSYSGSFSVTVTYN